MKRINQPLNFTDVDHCTLHMNDGVSKKNIKTVDSDETYLGLSIVNRKLHSGL